MRQQQITPGIIRYQFGSNEEWLHNRRGIGGSDASAVLGLNPYKTNEELWLEKTGALTPEDISDKPYVKYGHDAEPLLRDLFALDYPEYQVEYYENNLIRNEKYPWAHASLDGELVDQEGRRGILEIKTTNILQSMQREKWRDQIPDNYYIQVLHYLLVTEYNFAVLKAQLKSDWSGEIRLTTRQRVSARYHRKRQPREENWYSRCLRCAGSAADKRASSGATKSSDTKESSTRPRGDHQRILGREKQSADRSRDGKEQSVD